MNIEKLCWRCKKIKSISEFSKNRTKRDGYAAECKECANSYRENKKNYDEGNNETFIIEHKELGVHGFWSKYGGNRKAILQEAVDEIWYCQSCGEQQPADLKPYKKELIPGEFIRVCALCINDGSISLDIRINKILILEK